MNNTRKTQFSAFVSLTKRHFLVFIKNFSTVIFTLMVPLSVLLVYVLFLRGMEISQMQASLDTLLADVDPSKASELSSKFYALADSWMISGVMAVGCITVSLNTNYIVVKDKEHGLNKDMISSPIDSSVIVLSYFTFNFMVTFVTNLIVYLICLLYLLCYNAYMISILDFFANIGILLLSSVSGALVTHFLCSFINSDSIMAPVVAIFSAAIGFLIDAYLPGNMMPAPVQTMTGLFPGTYSGGLFRNFMLSTPVEKLLSDPALAGHTEEIKNIVSSFNVSIDSTNHVNIFIDFFGINVNTVGMVLIMVGAIIVFLILNLIIAKRNQFFCLVKAKKETKTKAK